MKTTVLYLYSRIPPYQVPVLRELTSSYGFEVHVVCWDKLGNSPFVAPEIENVTFYQRSSLTKRSLHALVDSLAPSLAFVSGWQDRGYLDVLPGLKRRGVPVLTGFDDIWKGSVRQRIGALLYPLLLGRCYSHAWVSGPRQYEFAKKLGFRDSNILYHLYSGDTSRFSVAARSIQDKKSAYPECFLFVGRLVSDKGVDVLAKAFSNYRKKYNGKWRLVCCGNGPLGHLLEGQPNIELHNYMDQGTIIEMIPRIGAFVLPSRVDVSPLVVHEFATAGLPLILSDSIGNRLLFLIDGFNGFSFRSESADDLARKFHEMESRSSTSLVSMSENSVNLSLAHNTKFVAASLASLCIRT